MDDRAPLITLIIPTRPGAGDVLAVMTARALDYPPDRLEIIVARGRQPAVQRNAALQAAHGDIIYFLDDDSRPFPQNLRRAVEHFRNPAVQMVGGPNVCPPEAPRIEKVFSVVLSSWLAFGPSRARYTPVGPPRPATEKELILCNLLARRDSLVRLGGFNEALYPNEENALMDRLQADGAVLIYDPDVAVFRRPRPNLPAFIRMLLNYGRGRAEQFRLHPTLGSALNIVPPVFSAYLLLLPLLGWWIGALALAPLAAYAAVLLLQTLALMPQHGTVNSFLALPLIFTTHVFYGFGFWWGLLTRPKPSITTRDVQLETIPV